MRGAFLPWATFFTRRAFFIVVVRAFSSARRTTRRAGGDMSAPSGPALAAGKSRHRCDAQRTSRRQTGREAP